MEIANRPSACRTSRAPLSLRLAVAAMAGLAGVAGFTGCAARSPVAPGAESSQSRLVRPVVTQGAHPGPPEAYLTLSEIRPEPTLPTPATQPTAPPSLNAIQLFAQARAAQDDNQRYTAINLLEKAVKADPYSVELYTALAHAHLGNNAFDDASLSALEMALKLDPDNLQLQYESGRQYLAKGDTVSAVQRLRLALQTTDYKSESDDETAALTDFFLAKALAQRGYARAALDRYDLLLKRLQQPENSARNNAELGYLIAHPEILYAQVGELYEKHGDMREALQAYELAAARDADNFDFQSSVVRLLPAVGQNDEARKKAVELVMQFHASAPSLAVLKQIYRHLGGEPATLEVLGELHRTHPDDRSLYFALLDELKIAGKSSEAERLLAASAREGNADPQVVRKLFDLYEDRDDLEGAMRLLVETLANRPDSLRDLGPLWADLLKPGHGNRVRLAVLQKLDLPARAEASRLYWVSRVAELWGRDALAASALEQAAACRPMFPPVDRLLIDRYWARADWTDASKTAATTRLIETARAENQPALAAELEGLSQLSQKHPAAAAQAFTQAVTLGNHSPDLQLTLADAYVQDHKPAKAVQLLQKLLTDVPTCGDAYSVLFDLYLHEGSGEQAATTLRRWLDADPMSVDARLLQAAVLAQGNGDGVGTARTLMQNLINEQPENIRVLASAQAFYARQGETNQFVARLEDERVKHPDNREAVQMLVLIYADQKRLGEASRVLDAARAALAKDPDQLYAVAHLYERIDQKTMTEEVLEQVLTIDPHHAGANNDLGYTWADQGKNLAQAEELIRVAVEAEPDNQSYLDSLGWVEYKRGKFEEARTFLDRALAPSTRPDPVVLDHMGDVLYRLARVTDAAKEWKRSLQRLQEVGSTRDDLRQLKLQLEQKLRQQEQGQPVNVAPVVENATRATQAKN